MTVRQKRLQELSGRALTNSLEKKVNEELLQMGVSYEYTGTYYLRDAIIFAVKEKPGQHQTSRELMRKINAQVANKYRVKTTTVICQMRYSIECAFAYGDIDCLLNVFKGVYDYDKGRVKNAAFIMTTAEKIKQDIAAEQQFNTTQLRILIQGEVENITDPVILENLYGIVHAL